MRLKNIGLSLIAAGLLIGCGSSSDSGDSTQTGTFVDAPVAGMSYETTSGISGTTDEAGHFKYKDGDYVSFKLGNVNLGTTKGLQTVTPLHVTDNDPQKAAYIAYILQNLDTDGDNTDDVIKLPDEETLSQVLSSIDLDDEANVTDTVTQVKDKIKEIIPDVTLPGVSITDANTTMIDYLKETGVMTTETGFTKEGLVGKTFYDVDYDLEDCDGWCPGYRSFTFNDTTFTITDTSDEENGVIHITIPYTIDENGEMIIDYPNATSNDVDINEVPIPHDTNGSAKIVNIIGDKIEILFSNNEDVYFTTSKEEAEKLAVLLNVKDTKSYKPLIDSGITVYNDSLRLLPKYEGYGVFTEDSLSGYSALGERFYKNISYNSDYTQKTFIDEDGDASTCWFNGVDIVKGAIERECDDGALRYFFLSETEAKNYVNLKINESNAKLIDPKTLIGEILYSVGGNGIDGMKLTTDNKIVRYYQGGYTSFDSLPQDNGDYSYNVTYSGDKITIQGYDGDEGYSSSEVYDINLAGVSIASANDISFKLSDGDDVGIDVEPFTFTKGHAYCYLLWDRCWLDKDGIDEILSHTK